MTKQDLIHAIRQRVPTAPRSFLQQFSMEQLAEYFHAAEFKAAKQARAGLLEVSVG